MANHISLSLIAYKPKCTIWEGQGAARTCPARELWLAPSPDTRLDLVPGLFRGRRAAGALSWMPCTAWEGQGAARTCPACSPQHLHV
jgi:hypothetical protein